MNLEIVKLNSKKHLGFWDELNILDSKYQTTPVNITVRAWPGNSDTMDMHPDYDEYEYDEIPYLLKYIVSIHITHYKADGLGYCTSVIQAFNLKNRSKMYRCSLD